MKSIWKAIYGNNEIRVENSWFSGEALYVNSQLQDKTLNLLSAPKLTGHILENGQKLSVKANLYSGFLSVKCNLFIDDKEVKLQKVK